MLLYWLTSLVTARVLFVGSGQAAGEVGGDPLPPYPR